MTATLSEPLSAVARKCPKTKRGGERLGPQKAEYSTQKPKIQNPKLKNQREEEVHKRQSNMYSTQMVGKIVDQPGLMLLDYMLERNNQIVETIHALCIYDEGESTWAAYWD